MANIKFYLIAICFAGFVVTLANSAHILDLLTDETDSGNKREQNSRNCLCKGSACVCCLDFNFTLIDLGGPGCVHMKYLSQDEGFAVNISYGKNMLHSSTIKGSNPAPICLDVFSKLAQMCARVSELAPTSDGLRGCLQFEPHIMGDVQLEFPVGCFKSGPTGMEMEPPKEEATPDKPGTEEETEEEDVDYGLSAETFLQVVNHTAEQGIQLFSSILGLVNRNGTSTAPQPTSTNSDSVDSSNNTVVRRKAKELIHPNHF